MNELSRFVVGIDLGTTNCAVAFVDTAADGSRVDPFPIAQPTGPGEVAPRDTLPSFLYLPAPGEADSGRVVGEYARERGAVSPRRLVTSAKSWLCHPAVDRTASILPWQAPADVPRLSPVAASSAFLAHIREAWNHAHPGDPLEEQSIVLTVPASFDETARELTVLAAQDAGLHHLTLLEEPQAAFYAWMDLQPNGWVHEVEAGQRILVCDIGGGTTDFALIEVQATDDGEIGLQRIAVGDHLLLGGDNLDLALAHRVEEQLGDPDPLPPTQWQALVRACRDAKERLLGEDAPDHYRCTIPGGGSRVIGGSRGVDLDREEVRTLLVDGFMPRVAPTDRPHQGSSGFQEFGLPFAADPAMTSHLAAFLSDQGEVRPDAVLLNGGVFESPGLRDRWMEALTDWGGGDCRLLDNPRLDLAVARGAAAYGLVRRGQGTRIGGGLARAYYVGVESQTGDSPTRLAAMCVAPSGLEEGSEVKLESVFDLKIRRPVEFPVFMSSTRVKDLPGAIVPIEPGQLSPLPPVRTVLKSGRKSRADTIQVRLRSRLTELGTLETWFHEVGGTRRWRLQFDVRGQAPAGERDEVAAGPASVLDESMVRRAQKALRRCLEAREGKQAAPAGRIFKAVEEALGEPREDWSPPLLRGLWDTLQTCASTRARGAAQEARWLNLVGFVLRPGYGYVLDDWRVEETWKIFPGRLHFASNEMCRAEWWILWRRIAGGLQRGQQETLAAALIRAVKAGTGGQRGPKPTGALRGVFRGGSHETAEVWRLLGSLERLPVPTRVELGDLVVDQVRRRGPGVWNGAGMWALGRLGGRVPQYGPLHEVAPPEQVEAWLSAVMNADAQHPAVGLAMVLMARRTGDRFRDVSASMRASVVEALRDADAPEHQIALVEEGGRLDADERAHAFGERLPAGIGIRG